MVDAEATLAHAKELIQQGDETEASLLLSQLIQQKPDHAAAYFYLGKLLHLRDQLKQAEIYYQKTLELEPHFFQARQNLESLYLLAQKDLNRQVMSSPDNPDIWLELVRIYRMMAQRDAVRQTLKKAYQHHPQHPQIFSQYVADVCNSRHFQEARRLLALEWGNTAEAIPFLKSQVYLAVLCQEPSKAVDLAARLVRLNPETVTFLQDLFQELLLQRADKVILPFLDALCRRIPAFQSPRYYDVLIEFFANEGDIESATFWLTQSQQAAPENPWYDLTKMRLLPAIYQDQEEILNWRQSFEAELDAALERLSPEYIQRLRTYQRFPNLYFYLAYQGLDCRPLLEKAGQFWQQVFPAKPPGPRQRQGPLRIAFISSCFHFHSVGSTYIQLIQYLYRQTPYEIAIFSAEPSEKRARLNEENNLYLDISHHYIALPWKLEPSIAHIQRFEPDLIIFPELGMDTMTYFLACLKLAPVQAVLTGHPITSGLKTVDYYVSAQALESPDIELAQSFYTENLVFLSEISVCYSRAAVPEPLLSKSELKLVTDAPVYLCPITLFKLHPDFDRLLAGILEKDPAGHIYFFRTRDTQMHEKVRARFEKSLGSEALQRVHFLPWQPRMIFYHYLKQADVILDTLHFGAGTTAFQALAMGTPIVTLPEDRMPSRQVYSLYHYMRFYECVAKDEADYIRKAVHIATNPTYRQYLETKINEQSDVIFGNFWGLKELADLIPHWCDLENPKA